MDRNNLRQTSDRLAGFRGADSPSAKTDVAFACFRAEGALRSGPQLQHAGFYTIVGSIRWKMFIVCIFILKSLKTPTNERDYGTLVSSIHWLHKPQSKISFIRVFRVDETQHIRAMKRWGGHISTFPSAWMQKVLEKVAQVQQKGCRAPTNHPPV